jgi:hypothetical protein
MKTLIAYDGSENAEKGIDDLSRARLPSEADALAVSVAEVWLSPPPGYEGLDDTFPLQISAGVAARALFGRSSSGPAPSAD